jgi:hypothetical protein
VSNADLENIEEKSSKEQDLLKAQKAIAGDVPLIPSAPSTRFDLPRGRFNGSEWETEVEVRELTGEDEEALARTKDPIDFFDAVVVHGTSRLGSVQLDAMTFTERQGVLSSLLIGEREQLFLRIASATYGDEKEFKHSCPSCNVSLDTIIFLSKDIKVSNSDKAAALVNTFTTSKGGTITYRLATGSDQMEVLHKKGATTAEQNTLMLSECITEIDGGPVLNPLSAARSLSMGDRRKLLDILTSSQPSPDMNLEVACISCNFEMVLPLSWGDIFRP